MTDNSVAPDALTAITRRLRVLEANPRAEVAGGVQSVLFVDLPAVSPIAPGRLFWCANGRKVGEGVGAGSGVLVADDGTNWIHVATDTPVAV